VRLSQPGGLAGCFGAPQVRLGKTSRKRSLLEFIKPVTNEDVSLGDRAVRENTPLSPPRLRYLLQSLQYRPFDRGYEAARVEIWVLGGWYVTSGRVGRRILSGFVITALHPSDAR